MKTERRLKEGRTKDESAERLGGGAEVMGRRKRVEMTERRRGRRERNGEEDTQSIA